MQKRILTFVSVMILFGKTISEVFAIDIGVNTIGTQTGLPTTSIASVVGNILGFITELIAILSILMIVISGIMYLTSGGDSGRATAAKGYLTNSIIGLVMAILAYSIVVIVGGLLGAW